MRYVVSIGANLGDPVTTVTEAIVDVPLVLDSTHHLASSLYGTSPIGGPQQPDFVNAVVIVDANLAPEEVLTRLQGLEARAGRVRDVRWGPRSLDLDIVAADALVSDDPDLTLPHPRAHERGFVLVPWLEIDPHAYLPGRGSARELIESLDADQRVRVLDIGSTPE